MSSKKNKNNRPNQGPILSTQKTPSVSPTEELADEVEVIVEENDLLENKVEELGGDPEELQPVNKTFAELKAIVEGHMKAIDGDLADAPAYIAGDGTMFSKKRFTDGMAHVKKTAGMKLFHCEYTAKGGWAVKSKN